MAAGHDEGGAARPLADRAAVPARVGEYEVLGVLGAGAMGTVLKVRHPRLGRLAALKLLQRQTGTAQQRFRVEAQASGRLAHPNIVTVYDAGTLEDGRDFIAMELVEGETLRQRLDRGPLREDVALAAARAIASGLQHAHAAGVIHRDLKPENILFDRSDQPKVADFGLARVADSRATRATTEGALLGTPHYMSPEQATGESADERSDVFALGAVLYEMLTGELAFPGETLAHVLFRVTSDDPRPPRALAPRLSAETEAICLRALEKDPDRRYASARDLVLDLDRRLAGDPTAARPIGPVRRLARRARRHPAVAALVAALVLLLGVAALAGGYALSRPGTLRVALRPALEPGREATLRVARFRADGGLEPVLVASVAAPASELALALRPGGYQLRVERADFVDTALDVIVTRGNERDVIVESAPVTAPLDIETDPTDAVIELAPDRTFGRRVASFFTDPFPVGRHHLRVTRPGHHPHEREVELRQAGGARRTRVTLPRLLAWEAAQTNFLAQVLVGPGSRPWAPSRVLARNQWSQILELDGATGRSLRQQQLPGRLVSGNGVSAFVDVDGDGAHELFCVVPGGGATLLRSDLSAPLWQVPFADPADTNGAGWASCVVGPGPAGPLALWAVPAAAYLQRLTDGATLWRVALPRERTLHEPYLAMGDVRGVGEVAAVLAHSRSVRVHNVAGEVVAQVALRRGAAGAPMLADLDGAPGLEVVLPLDGGGVLAWSPAGDRTLWDVAVGATGAAAVTSAVGLALRRDAAGGVEVVVATEHMGAPGLALLDRAGALRGQVQGAARRARPLPPIVTDWDHDGAEDVVLAAGTIIEVFSFLEGAPPRVIFTYDAAPAVVLDLAVADVDGDGWEDLVAAYDDGRVRCLSAPHLLWRQSVGAGSASPPLVAGAVVVAVGERGAVACALDDGRRLWTEADAQLFGAVSDVDGDGALEVLVSRFGGTMAALAADDGALRWTLDLGAAPCTPLLVDLDGDGRKELITASVTSVEKQIHLVNTLNIFHGATGLRWAPPLSACVAPRGGFWGAPIAAGDLDGDGLPEVVAIDQQGVVHAVDPRTQTERWRRATSRPDQAPQSARAAPVLVDADGDGRLDVIALGRDGALHLFLGPDGTPAARVSVGAATDGGILLADVAPRAGPELLVTGASRDGPVLVCFTPQLEVLWGVRLPAGAVARPVSGDLDGDGRPDVLVADVAGRVSVLRGADGAWRWGLQPVDGHTFRVAPELHDVDGDGALDVVLLTQEGELRTLRGRRRAAARGWAQAGGDPGRTRRSAPPE